MKIQNNANLQSLQSILNQTAKNTTTSATTEQTQQTAQTTVTKNTDILILTEDVPTTSDEEKFNKLMEQQKSELENLKSQLKDSKRQAEATRNLLNNLAKCLVIASRISSGDKVPRADYKFLLKNQPKLYSSAIQLRVSKEKPKEYKQLSEKEKCNKKKPFDPSSDKNTDEFSCKNTTGSDITVELDMLIK